MDDTSGENAELSKKIAECVMTLCREEHVWVSGGSDVRLHTAMHWMDCQLEAEIPFISIYLRKVQQQKVECRIKAAKGLFRFCQIYNIYSQFVYSVWCLLTQSAL